MTTGAIEAGKAVVRLSLESTLRRDLAKQTALLRKFSMRAGRGIASVGAGFASLAKAGIAGGIAGGGAAGFLIKLGAEAEKTNLVFRNLIGNQEDAVKLVAKLNKFADSTPFSNEDILQAGKLLLNTGTAVSDVQDEISVLATLAARAGARTQDLALILQDIRGKGKIDTQDIRQFAARGINLRGALQETMGLDAISFQKRLQSPLGEGAIDPETVEKALASIAAKTPALLKEMGESFDGLTSTLMGSLRSLGKEFGAMIIEDFDLKSLLADSIQFLKDNRDSIKEWFSEFLLNVRAAGVVLSNFAKKVYEFFKGILKFFLKNAPIAQGPKKLFEQRMKDFELIKKTLRAEDELRARRKQRLKEMAKIQSDPAFGVEGILSLDDIVAGKGASSREFDLKNVARARETLARRAQSRRRVAKGIGQATSSGLSGFFSGLQGLAGTLSQGAGVVGAGANLAGLKAALMDSFRQASTGTFSGFAVRRGLAGSKSNPLLQESKEQTKLLQAIEKATEQFQAKLGVA